MEENSNNAFLIAFGENLKKLRKELNFSQEKLAYESGIELRQIGRIERGEINTGILSVKIISETLGVAKTRMFEF